MSRFGVGTFVLALGLAAAPRLQAQGSNVVVCQDGQVASASDNRVCNGHGGINRRATVQARRSAGRTANGGYGTRGVYGGGTAGGNGTRGVYGGGNGTRGVYGGSNGGNAQQQCADGSWIGAGSSGCNGRGGVANRNGNNGNGGWIGQRSQGRDEDRDDDRGDGDGRKRGKGHDKKDKRDKHDNDDRREH